MKPESEPEMDRIKNDLATMQKAIGLAPSPGREWAPWLRRDNLLNLLFCLPGVMLLASAAFLPSPGKEKFLGLVAAQWTGVAVALVLLGILAAAMRISRRPNGRPDGLVREYKRINRHVWAILPPLGLYFLWGAQHSVDGAAFTAGLWIWSGSLLGVMAVLTGVRVYFGWAVPLVIYGLSLPLLKGVDAGLALGAVMIAGALLCVLIQAREARRLERTP